ncbi:MAG: helix-turn-helix domain-containing protein [Dysgonomonas sp.]
METTLNTELLANLIKEKRGSKGLRETAQEISNVSFSTLSRIEQGKVPDVDTFIKICQWLEVSADTFIIDSQELKEVPIKDKVIAHLRAEKVLSKDTVNMLIKMIDVAYNNK